MPSHCFTWLITDQLAVPIVQNYGRQGFFSTTGHTQLCARQCIETLKCVSLLPVKHPVCDHTYVPLNFQIVQYFGCILDIVCVDLINT